MNELRQTIVAPPDCGRPTTNCGATRRLFDERATINVLSKHFLNRIGGIVFPGPAVAGRSRMDDDVTVIAIVYRLVMTTVMRNFKADFFQSLSYLLRHAPVAAEQGFDFGRPLLTDFLVIIRIDDVLDDIVAARVLGQRFQFF